MTQDNNRLPDVLRPTELHDFSDLFAGQGGRPGRAKIVLAIVAVVVMILGAQLLVEPSRVASVPAPATDTAG